MTNKINASKRIYRLKLDCSLKTNKYNERNFHHGYQYVDLGLPSGTLWATCNVGAESETNYGNYYMYGYGNKTHKSSDEPYIGTENPLASSSDTATQVWGGKWHIPTSEQMEELFSYCSRKFVSDFKGIAGVKGFIFTSTINENSIFLPSCGYKYRGGNYLNEDAYYQTSTPNGIDYTYYLYCSPSDYEINYCARKYAFSVRPVLNLE